MTTHVARPELTHVVGNRLISAPEGVVPLAAKTARFTTLEELQHPSLLLQLYEARNRFSMTRSSLLPVETDLRDHLSPRINILDRHISRLEHALDFEGLPVMDPNFLSWKTAEGFPAFSVFTLENPICTVSFRRLNRLTQDVHMLVDPKLPKCMFEQFADTSLMNGLRDLCAEQRLESITLTARYQGAMPEEVRAKIQHFTEGDVPVRFEQIFIVAEAPGGKWEEKRIPQKDPLVIGVAFGLLWLIAAFDLTPSELFAREMCLHTARIPLN